MRNESLEGLRGVAALLVVFFHMQFYIAGLGPTRNGYLAVDLFFVLSGYVICEAYGANVGDAWHWRAFIVRRFGRLWPTHVAASALYYAMILMNAALAHLEIGRFLPSFGEVLGIAFLAQGLNVFDHDVGTAVSWSASGEFYVYLVFGLVCLNIRGRARLVAFAGLALLGFAIAIWQTVGVDKCFAHGHCFDMTYRNGWARCLVGFFSGALVAEFKGHALIAALADRVPQALSFAVTLLLIGFADRMPSAALAAPIVFAALIGALSRNSGPVASIFRSRAAQYLGGLSYSLYLAHAIFRPVLRVAAIVKSSATAHAVECALFLLASFALAHALRHFIETPYRRRFNAYADATFLPPSASISKC